MVSSIEELMGGAEMAGWMWPVGEDPEPHETLQAQAGGGHKEMRWWQLDEATREAFRVATREQWEKWVENSAIEVLSLLTAVQFFKILSEKVNLTECFVLGWCSRTRTLGCAQLTAHFR